MRKINIYFSPLYIIASFVTIYLGGLGTFCYYFVALCMHEYSHYFVSKRLGYMLNNLSFLPYGAKLKGNTNYKNTSHEIMVALGGPFCNLLIAGFIIALWWIKPITYAYTYEFVWANLVIGIFNLLPLFPLDGGQVFLNIFKTSKTKKIAYKIMQILGVIVSVLFLCMFVYSAFEKINFSFIFIAIFMFTLSIIPYNVDYLSSIQNIDFKLDSYAECKTYIVSVDTNFLQLVKIINANYYYYFNFVDKNFKTIKTLTEKEILNYINNGKYYI